MSVPDIPERPLRLASGRSIDVVANGSTLRSLAEVLTPGDVVSARVVDRFPSGEYLFAVRGRNLVASSEVPLAQDSVVRFEVLAGDGDTVRLRIAAAPDGAAATGAQAPTPTDLGLTDDAVTRLALAAFADADAPLDRARLQAAAQALAAAPEDARPALAAAFARLAASDLPATPPLVALAQRASAGLPRAAAALSAAVAALATLATDDNAPAMVPTSARDPAGSAAPQVAVGGRAPVPVASDRAGRAPAPAATVAVAGDAADGDERGGAVSAAAATAAADTASTADAATASRAATDRPATPPDRTIVADPAAHRAASATAIDDGAAIERSTVAPPSGVAAAARGVAPTASAAFAVALGALADLLPPPPDAGTGGAEAVRMALALVGVRADSADDAASPTRAASGAAAPVRSAGDSDGAPIAASRPVPIAAGPSATDPSSPSLLPRLAAAAHALGGDPSPAARTALAAVTGAVREVAAATVLKPADLAEYDLVVPLALTAHGEPAPARLAIARRASASGVVATFLRVDVELSRLGRVSARLSGIAGGPLAVTIVAGPAARASLGAELAALEDDLAGRGAPARVRLVDPSEVGDD